MNKLIILILAFASLGFSQTNGTPVEVVSFPSGNVAYRNFFDGSGNLIYRCITTPNGPWNNASVPAVFSWTGAGTTLTSIVVATNVATATTSAAHGLWFQNQVTVSGSTTSALNGTYAIATVPSATTFTFSTSGVVDGTYNNMAIVLSTGAPRSTAGIWSIFYGHFAGNNWDGGGYADGSSRLYTHVCDNRTTYTYK